MLGGGGAPGGGGGGSGAARSPARSTVPAPALPTIGTFELASGSSRVVHFVLEGRRLRWFDSERALLAAMCREQEEEEEEAEARARALANAGSRTALLAVPGGSAAALSAAGGSALAASESGGSGGGGGGALVESSMRSTASSAASYSSVLFGMGGEGRLRAVGELRLRRVHGGE
jgi:hypothetical protein